MPTSVHNSLSRALMVSANQSQHEHSRWTQNSFEVQTERKPNRHLQVQEQREEYVSAKQKGCRPWLRKLQLHQLVAFAVSEMFYKLLYMMNNGVCAAQICPASVVERVSNEKNQPKVQSHQPTLIFIAAKSTTPNHWSICKLSHSSLRSWIHVWYVNWVSLSQLLIC